MISKWKDSFEYIPKKILDKLPKKDRNDLYKFRRVRRKVFEWENDVEELNNEIKNKKKRIKEYKKIVTHLYEKINVLRSDFVPIVNVVSYSKSGSLYWNLNVKMKKQIRSIYLGSDKKLRENFSYKSLSNSSSVMTLMPSSSAFSSLLPASAPISKKSVFFETEPATFIPIL